MTIDHRAQPDKTPPKIGDRSQSRQPLLFRNEVGLAKRTKWLGEVVLIRPISFRIYTVFAALLAAGLLIFLIFGTYTKSALVIGILAPTNGLLKIQSPQNALLVEKRVEEGEHVTAGQVLFVLTSDVSFTNDVNVGPHTCGGQKFVLTAPQAGVVTSVLAEPGKNVVPSNVLASLSNDTDLEAEVYLSSREAGFVKPGQSVRLRYSAYPYQRFGQYDGHVKHVARTPSSPSELPAQISQSNEKLYRAKIALDSQNVMSNGRAEKLMPGTQVEVDILQEKRSLLKWVLEPLLRARGKV